MAPATDAGLDDSPDAAAGYHRISPLAVGSVVFGLMSPLALISTLLLIVPALGVGLSLLALRAIRTSEGEIAGGGWAKAGLFLSLLFAAAAPAKAVADRTMLYASARPIADAWFEFLREGQPQKAHQLTVPAPQRKVLNDQLWNFYRGSKENRTDLRNFVAMPVPRLVLEHGKQCEVRYYEPVTIEQAGDTDRIGLLYAVTYPDGPGKSTVFAMVEVERRTQPSGVAWRITNFSGGNRPASMPE